MKKIILSFAFVAAALSTSFGQLYSSGNNTIGGNNVGIGTNAPKDLLQVGTVMSKVSMGSAAYGGANGWGTSYLGFNVTKSGSSPWLVETDGYSNGGSMIYGNVGGAINFACFSSTNNGTNQTFSNSNLLTAIKMKIESSGNVFIGNNNGNLLVGNGGFTQNKTNANGAAYRLYVKGGIITEEVKVELAAGNWADYVFANDYKLTSLAEVEQHIAETGHLHNIASAAEIEAEGLELKSITINQQEKIEEIFLHLIEMEKKMKALEGKVKQLETEKAALKALLPSNSNN